MTSPTPPIPNAFRVVIAQRYLGRPIYNSLGAIYTGDATPTPVTAENVARSVGEAWKTNVLPVQHALLQFEHCLAYSLQDRTVQGIYVSPGNGGLSDINAGGAVAMTSALAANVQLITGRRGRRFRGRTGIAGLVETGIAGNILSADYATQISTAFGNFRADCATNATGDPAGTVPVRLAVISETYGVATDVIEHNVRQVVGTRVARLKGARV